MIGCLGDVQINPPISSLTNNFHNCKLEYVDVVDCPCNLTFQDKKIFLWHDDDLKIGKSALRKI